MYSKTIHFLAKSEESNMHIPMTFPEYAAQTASTAIYPGAGTGSPLAIAYCVLGLNGEIAEYLEAQTADESGDVWWYVARLAAELGITEMVATQVEGHSYERENAYTLLLMTSARMGNAAKKLLRDTGPVKAAKQHRRLTAGLLRFVDQLRDYDRRQGHAFGQVLARNAAKLASRKDRGVLQGDGGSR